jgi:hypothetical protein
MAQGSQRQPFEIPFTFSLNNIVSIVADDLSKKHFWRSTDVLGQMHRRFSAMRRGLRAADVTGSN